MAKKTPKNTFRNEIRQAQDPAVELQRNREIMIKMFQARKQMSLFPSHEAMVKADTVYLQESADKLSGLAKEIVRMPDCEGKPRVVSELKREIGALEGQLEDLKHITAGSFSGAQELTLDSLLKARMWDELDSRKEKGKDADDGAETNTDSAQV